MKTRPIKKKTQNSIVYSCRVGDKARTRMHIFQFMVQNVFYCVASNTKRYFYLLVKMPEFKENKKGEYLSIQYKETNFLEVRIE